MFSIAARRQAQTHRRLTEVAARPAIATYADIELLLRAHGVREALIWQVDDLVVQSGVDAESVWAWVMEHDGSSLATLVATTPAAEVIDELQRVEAPVLAIAS